ncbi:MIP/aquaporin family protein [soil metagenome]
MRDAWRHFAAEFIGIFALVFIGGATIMSSTMANINPMVPAAIAHGLILAIMVTATMRISGHLNPAVTIGFMVTKRIEPMMGVVYIIAQLLGAAIAAYALKATFPHAIAASTRLGGQSISADTTMLQAVLCEAIATFFLVFVVFGTAVDPHAPRIGGFAIGLTVTADILAIGSRTGGSMNPARSFGPAVVSGILEGQVVYWVGPILGGIAAAVLYDQLFLRRGKEMVDHGAIKPND